MLLTKNIFFINNKIKYKMPLYGFVEKVGFPNYQEYLVNNNVLTYSYGTSYLDQYMKISYIFKIHKRKKQLDEINLLVDIPNLKYGKYYLFLLKMHAYDFYKKGIKKYKELDVKNKNKLILFQIDNKFFEIVLTNSELRVYIKIL